MSVVWLFTLVDCGALIWVSVADLLSLKVFTGASLLAVTSITDSFIGVDCERIRLVVCSNKNPPCLRFPVDKMDL